MNEFLFVVVLYEMSMSQSLTVRSLSQRCARFRQQGIHLLVIDNTPGVKPESSAVDGETEYISFGENRGLTNAYQTAFLMAKAKNFRFLVLFDQDSDVNDDFIGALDGMANDYGSSIAIWCPEVICGETPISPYSLNSFGWPNFYPRRESKWLYGINSFSVVNVRFVQAIGGFEQFYWLDCLDTWLYEQAHKSNWSVRRLSASVKHDLSLVSGRTTPSRMRNIAFYESSLALELWSGGRILGTVLRLALRGIMRAKAMGGLRNSWYYLKEIVNGARAGLKRRSGKAARLTRNHDSFLSPPKPRISVCMATYNGEKFVARQLQTILSQLEPGDEIVISDDSSTDGTLKIIESFGDSRIRLFAGQSFRSPTYNFENALRQSRGDVIFLSDQDDEWIEGWVETALAELRNVNLVVCNAYMIDAEGHSLVRRVDSVLNGIRRTGLFHNLYQNGYMGCCCAFRREVLDVALPFPARLPWHDWWIGLVAEVFFDTKFIQTKMIRYRRHDSNASPTGEKSKLTLREKISMRWRMMTGLIRLAIERNPRRLTRRCVWK
jgi:glycosyltransferase involved in cell wall biosynthesis